MISCMAIWGAYRHQSKGRPFGPLTKLMAWVRNSFRLTPVRR